MATSSEAAPDKGMHDRPPPSSSDIQDELRDHLACRQDELEAAGLPPDAAAAEAERQFGNPARIARELFWLHNGDRIMTQRLMWVAVVCVILALMAALYMQNRQYQIMLQHQQAVAAELAAKTQAALAAVQERMPTASARIRIVDENGKPRPGRVIWIMGTRESTQLSGATYSGSLTSDADGWVDTGPLPLGEYTAEDRYRELKLKFVRLASIPFQLFRAGEFKELALSVPTVELRTITVRQPELPAEVKFESQPYWSASRPGSFGASDYFEFDVPTTIVVNPNSRLTVAVAASTSKGRVRGELSRKWFENELPSDNAVLTLGTVEVVDGKPRLMNEPARATSQSSPTEP
ncbi:MAG: hypothetical protein AMXMBFR47_02220 [Planctomycetota bacterium]